ncbi:hypothetical protein NDU88_002309 [Pleurodeles waltl]|uniref:Uncharacterized protein n=1 Tax=Pleurodeles waltl TaxID=8319 RepID=A0AAV7U9B7_PLEWA|nr:hypothetical protein NDU88_002309 [Pleurodeles waltl]
MPSVASLGVLYNFHNDVICDFSDRITYEMIVDLGSDFVDPATYDIISDIPDRITCCFLVVLEVSEPKARAALTGPITTLLVPGALL